MKGRKTKVHICNTTQFQLPQPFRGPRMGTARIDHKVGVERAGAAVSAREHFHTGTGALRYSRSSQRGHLGALEKGDIVQTPAQLEDESREMLGVTSKPR
jgi:hypothetical protein